MTFPFRARLRRQRQQHPVGPELAVVVEERTEGPAIEPLDCSPERRGGVILRLAHRRPHAVDAFEIGAPMMFVVRLTPQARRMRAGNECKSCEPQVPCPLRYQAAMVAIVADDEQQSNEDAVRDGKENIDGERKARNGADKRCKIEQQMNGKDAESTFE